MLYTGTGKGVTLYHGAITFPNDVTFSTVETSEGTVELYVSEDHIWHIDEVSDYYIGDMETPKEIPSWEIPGELLKKYYNSSKLSQKAKETLRDYYNEYYDNSTTFTKLV